MNHGLGLFTITVLLASGSTMMTAYAQSDDSAAPVAATAKDDGAPREHRWAQYLDRARLEGRTSPAQAEVDAGNLRQTEDQLPHAAKRRAADNEQAPVPPQFRQ